MNGLKSILRKELSDHFSSYRFIILFTLISMVALIIVYMAGIHLKQSLEGIEKPRFVFLMLFTTSGAFFSLVEFVAFFGPLIGLLLGFDAINRERNQGTLSKLLAQPIYRDTVINAKFLAGVVTISIMMISIVSVITGLGLSLIGVVPGSEELGRISIYLLISIVYISFWHGVAILFSIIFRSVGTSAMATLSAWIFFSFFISIGANIIAVAVAPANDARNPEAMFKQAKIEWAINLSSPMQLYSDSSGMIINPLKKISLSFKPMGRMERGSMERFSGPLPLSQSFMVVLPYIIMLLAFTVICFAISYIVFMRQEIRSL